MKKKTISSLTRRTKAAKAVLMFSLMLWSFLGLAIAPALSDTVPGEGQVVMKDIISPETHTPGTIFTHWFLIDEEVEDLTAFEIHFELSDPDMLMIIDADVQPPYYMTYRRITWGCLILAAQSYPSLRPGPNVNTTRTGGNIPVAWVKFYTLDIGTTDFIITGDTKLWCEVPLRRIQTHPHDGFFDNRWEARLEGESIQSASYEPGTTFIWNIYVDAPAEEGHKPIDIWGVQFRLEWDPNVLRAIPVIILRGGFTWFPMPPWWGPGWVEVAVAHPPGSLGTIVPPGRAVVSVEFLVLDWGTTALDIMNVKLADKDGYYMYNAPEIDGWFANTPDIAVALDTGFCESRKFKLSKDPEGLQTLTAQIKNVGGRTQAKMYFVVYDELGGLFDFVTAEGSIASEQTVRLSADIDVKDCAGQAFSVEVFGDYFKEGAWKRMNKGAPGAAKDKFVMSFTVEP